MNYEILRHSADEKFRAEGDTLEEAFKAATEAFSTIVKGGEGSGTHEIEVRSESLESLLFDYLDRLIYLQDTEGVAVSHAENIEIDQGEDQHFLRADIFVDPITPGMNFTDLKAPTYNEMKVEHGDKWVLEAVIDV